MPSARFPVKLTHRENATQCTSRHEGLRDFLSSVQYHVTLAETRARLDDDWSADGYSAEDECDNDFGFLSAAGACF